MSNSFNMYRPTSRITNAIVGYVAGKCDNDAKVRDNIKGRIFLAVEDIRAAQKEENDTALQGAKRRLALLANVRVTDTGSLIQNALRAVRTNSFIASPSELSSQDQVFCGLVVEEPTVTAPVAQAAQ